MIIRPDLQIIRPEFKMIRPDLQIIRPDLKMIRPDLIIIRPDLKITHFKSAINSKSVICIYFQTEKISHALILQMKN